MIDAIATIFASAYAMGYVILHGIIILLAFINLIEED